VQSVQRLVDMIEVHKKGKIWSRTTLKEMKRKMQNNISVEGK
jgi:hypothetical protein